MPATHLALDRAAQELLDHFSALLAIRIALFDADGRTVAVGLGRGSCGFCQLLRIQLGRDPDCRREDAFRFAQALRERAPVRYRCHAGLEESLVPLLADGLHFGYAMIGQYRAPGTPEPNQLLADWHAGHGDERLRQAWTAVPEADPRHVHGLFIRLVDLLVLRRLVDAVREPGVAAVLARLRRRPGDRLSVLAAATLAGTSPATLDRRLRAAVGCGLKALQVRLRLAAADAVLDRGGAVQDAAVAAGYDDAHYFSRLYRQHRGIAPSAARWPARARSVRSPDPGCE